jgi:putative membrane protein
MSQNNKYSIWIKIISVAIPVVVAILFTVKIPNATPLSFLPPIYACINALTAILLVVALIAIKSKKIKLHEWLMKTCIGLSLIFLVMYIAYHMTTDPTPFGGQGYIKILYFFILISHILLSIALIPLVLISYVRAFQKEFVSHKKIAKITFPVWLYVAITGVIVYVMISPYYIH